MAAHAEGVDVDGLAVGGGRGKGARHGVLVRGGSGFHLIATHLEDFQDEAGAALRIEGESEGHAAREIVVQACSFLNGATAVRLGRHATDLLIDDNRFAEITGPALEASVWRRTPARWNPDGTARAPPGSTFRAAAR